MTMSRTTKQPATRRQEFADTAAALFESKGYENTSVDDIVGKMGVAKGLFYYYFKTKDDVLDVIIDRLISDNAALMEQAASRPDLDALGKFRALMGAAAALRARSRKLTLFFHKESNRHLHADIEARAVRLMAPALARMIEQGVTEGVFDTEFPEETALSFFAVSSILGHEVYRKPDEAFFRRRVEAALCLVERLLGAKPGTFDFYKKQALEGPQVKKWLGQIRRSGGKAGGRGGRKGKRLARG
jgi:AcrR family transcriptional regulator